MVKNMDQKHFETLKSRFNEYVNSFRDNDGNLHPMMQLKYEHSQRVANEAREVAAALNWKEPELLMAEIIGLLHDVGRFSQFQDFQTYCDSKSVNHGCRGFEVLAKSDWLTRLSQEENHVILESVRLHNCHRLPTTITKDLRLFVNLVRDADKLDIFFVLNNAIEKDTLKNNPEIIWDLPQNIPPSPVIIEDLRYHRQASYENVKSQADFCLLQLCWIYDLNYAPTIKKVSERKIVDRIVQTLPASDVPKDAIQSLKQFLQTAA